MKITAFYQKKNVSEKKKTQLANETNNENHTEITENRQKNWKIKHETGWHEISACKPIPYERKRGKGCSDKHKKFKNVRSKDT